MIWAKDIKHLFHPSLLLGTNTSISLIFILSTPFDIQTSHIVSCTPPPPPPPSSSSHSITFPINLLISTRCQNNVRLNIERYMIRVSQEPAQSD
jgi:hypothetical protein